MHIGYYLWIKNYSKKTCTGTRLSLNTYGYPSISSPLLLEFFRSLDDNASRENVWGIPYQENWR